MRCDLCFKKLTFMQRLFPKCKCGYIFCTLHRPIMVHECEYNYKLQKVKLIKVVPDKVPKI